MTRRKRTGTAGKRLEERSSGIALYSELGCWVGKLNLDTAMLTTPNGTPSVPGTNAHLERVTVALKWMAENRPDLIAHAVTEATTTEP